MFSYLIKNQKKKIKWLKSLFQKLYLGNADKVDLIPSLYIFWTLMKPFLIT